jgi:hypothetical protein
MSVVLDGRMQVTGVLGRSARRMALLALLLLAAIPAAAQARNYQVDARVTGSPVAKGGSVTLSVVLSKRSGRAVKVGTRRVRVKFKRARLPVVGGGARASRMAPRALRAGHRLRGVTSLTKKSRRRLRYTARPTLKLKRVKVVRSVRRQHGAVPRPVFVPPPSGTQQIIRSISTRSTTLSSRIGRLSSINQQFARMKTLLLPVGLAGVTAAFQPLTAALEGRAGSDSAFEPLVAEVGAIGPSGDWLGTATGAINASVRITRTMASIGDAVETLAATSSTLGAQPALLGQMPGLAEQLATIDAALSRIEGRLGAVEAGADALLSGTDIVNDAMSAASGAAGDVTSDAAAADLATVSAGVDTLAARMASLAYGFATLQATMDGLNAELDGLDAVATTLETMVEGLEALGMGAG